MYVFIMEVSNGFKMIFEFILVFNKVKYKYFNKGFLVFVFWRWFLGGNGAERVMFDKIILNVFCVFFLVNFIFN